MPRPDYDASDDLPVTMVSANPEENLDVLTASAPPPEGFIARG
ncbi:hypothetical protein [Curtobacterium flaccumfaciens]|nr:hypothetical protein [Curtobacterium flaccumfaciens]